MTLPTLYSLTEAAANFYGVSVEMLERVYWHKSPDFQQEAVRR